MKKIFAALAALLATTGATLADSGIQRVPCGYQQIATVSASTALTIPTTCGKPPTLAVIVSEAQAVRYRDDGTAPTATVGMPLAVGSVLEYQGSLPKIRFIEQTSGAKLNVSYYR